MGQLHRIISNFITFCQIMKYDIVAQVLKSHQIKSCHIILSHLMRCRAILGVELMLRDTSQIYAGLVSVNVDIACPPIRSIWLQFANTGK